MEEDEGGVATPATESAVAGFAALPSDPTGIDTFERYVWQAKLAVLTWLSSLGPAGPIAIVAEHVEDLVVVERDLFRFAQLKTRDRGSWSAARICAIGHAVSKLIASYHAAKRAGLLDLSQFEVWLEGPPATDTKTKSFFADPTKAHADIRTKIRDLGLKGVDLADFLKRLRIRCNQPSRATIDAVALKAIGAAWPHMPHHQIVNLYERLLDLAAAAQSASEPPAVVRAAIAAGRVDPSDLDRWAPISAQVMLGQHLEALCPPLPATSTAELLERAAGGEATLLELKLVRAGASPETISSAISIRARADIVQTLAIAGGSVDYDDVVELDERVLSLAGAIANLARLDPAKAPAPAEHVFNELLSRPDVASTDVKKIFEGDYRLVLGRLCSLSDQCLFSWGHP